MKKIYSLLAAVLISGGLMAQNNVTFQVDMTGQTISSNGVHVAGNFQQAAGAPGNWDPAATSLTQVGTSNIYAVTVSIPAGNYEYKIINDNNWGPGEEGIPAVSQVSLGLGFGGGNSNRWLAVYGDTTLAPVLFAGAAPAGMENVTMVVDMSSEAVVNDTVSVAGNFANPNWSPGAQVMVDLFNDSIYRYTAYVPTNDTIAYKYINGDSWGQDEAVPSACAVGGNRQVIANNDTVAGPVCFGACSACFIPDTFDVTINIDMNYVCGFNDTVDIAGPFNGWSAGLDTNYRLTDPDNDGVYSITVRAPEPEFEFKARFHSNNNTNWESASNVVVPVGKDTILPVRCFSKNAYAACSPVPAPSDITFMVDVSTFPNPTDLNDMYVIADFTEPAWQSGKTLMTPVAGSPGIFEATFTDVCPGTIFYKFMNVTSGGTDQEEGFPGLTDSSCVVDNGNGGLNRTFTRANDQAVTIGYKYDQCESIISLAEGFDNFKLEVYPNPFNEYTTVSLPEDGSYSLQLIDISGQQVRVLNDVQGDVMLNKGQLTPGIYLLKVMNEKGQISNSKLTVQ